MKYESKKVFSIESLGLFSIIILNRRSAPEKRRFLSSTRTARRAQKRAPSNIIQVFKTGLGDPLKSLRRSSRGHFGGPLSTARSIFSFYFI